MRVVAPAAAVGMLLPLALSSPAQAQGSTVVRFGGTIGFSALAGAANHVVLFNGPGSTLRIGDTAGIIAGPGCIQENATTAICGNRATVLRFAASLRDGNDRLEHNVVERFPITVDSGSGIDEVETGPGNDMIHQRDGQQDLPTICGDGFDTVSADANGESTARDCERVFRD